jgi:hypothetical protein
MTRAGAPGSGLVSVIPLAFYGIPAATAALRLQALGLRTQVRSVTAPGQPSPKLLGSGMSPTALTWAFVSSVAKSSGYMLTSANVIMVSGHGHGFSVQKNYALISVLAGQGRSIYAKLQ